MECFDSVTVERNLIKAFVDQFKNVEEYGSEYFEGDPEDMKALICLSLNIFYTQKTPWVKKFERDYIIRAEQDTIAEHDSLKHGYNLLIALKRTTSRALDSETIDALPDQHEIYKKLCDKGRSTGTVAKCSKCNRTNFATVSDARKASMKMYYDSKKQQLNKNRLLSRIKSGKQSGLQRAKLDAFDWTDEEVAFLTPLVNDKVTKSKPKPKPVEQTVFTLEQFEADPKTAAGSKDQWRVVYRNFKRLFDL
jgi:hypothetical protein